MVVWNRVKAFLMSKNTAVAGWFVARIVCQSLVTIRGVARIYGKGVLTGGPKGPGKIFGGHAH